ncbi:sushi domain-containing protein 1 isoform X3 [Sander lucioperca]|uniref:sushi domain-containing protein 1 isoform X3 n=1 Tax=Sander lucioperca TaxID=283035 RepID=UPI00165376A1|nr:sushi domain-containing protein 1 isoform X3 [Sander lucioperca]
MAERNRAMIIVFLLCVNAEKRAAESYTLDVCASCHANATCDDKSDGSGKVCNCKYGFVGNGRTFCQDKDECQIGANKICGQHTTCHNTYGSYYCTCLAGYSPSNNMAIFIPNDGTHCQDIDECRITGLCGEGGQCRNLEGSFDCSCQLGYQVHNGAEPFHPHRDKASCKVVDCGPPASVEDTVLLSVTGTTYSSVAMFVCDEGFVWRRGDNRSVCGADGLWRGPTMVCEEVDCGSPPALPHSHMLWNKRSSMGTVVLYQCNSGYHNVGKGNVSICTAAGQWERPSVLCQETLCGNPPVIESTEQVWDSNSTPGSTVLYVCKEGFYNQGGDNVSICNENAQWTPPTLSCQEILCGDPPLLPHTGQVWNGSSTPGSTVTYYCEIGFYHNEGNNISLCTVNGYWTKPNISCKGNNLLQMTLMPWLALFSISGVQSQIITDFTQLNIAISILLEVHCGVPQPIPHSIMLWDKISTVGSQVVYQCNSGYRNVGEGNVSVCTSSGEWDEASLLCQEINCQEPVFKPHAKMLWDGTSHIGSVVYYQCEEGYNTRSLRNYSVCGENGLWEDIDLWCEAKCGPVPFLAKSEVVWHNRSVVIHRCVDGYHSWRGSNVSVCSSFGVWQRATLRCIEISCGPPSTLPNTNLLWDRTSRPGSVVLYECMDGFYQESGNNISTCLLSGQWGEVSVKCKAKCGPVPFLAKSEVVWHNRSVVIHRCVDGYHSWRGSNVSVCSSSGVWQRATLRCIEISCGPPLTLPDTNLLWDHTSRLGSVVLYECMDGFYQESGNNISTCLLSGQWGEVSVKCKAKCGPVPFLAKSEVVWHNRSVVIHRCVDGYHSWRGSNVSVCSSSGVWQRATLRCIEIKPAVNHLFVLNEKCLHWRAEKYEEDTEVYKVTYIGSRDYQRSFHDRRKQFLSSKADQLELCLNLLPVTNYSISITAVSSRFTATITTNTSLPVPPAPVVDYREFETPIPTLRLRRSPNTLDPISLYQVFVLPVEGIMMFDCSSPASSDPSGKIQSFTEYITAQIDVTHVGTEMNFTVGDGLYYGGFFNAPLENGRNYYITLRAVSQWKSALKSSCVLWAKVRGTSYVLRVSSLSAAATIGLVAFIILVGYSFTWYRRWYNSAYYPPC